MGASDRRLRVRLARQRPAPDRLRTRYRASLTWWRRIPWAHIGAVVGVVAAIGGLIFTAVATYYSAAVSKDQLQQSQEDAEQHARAQAQLVSSWVELKIGDSWALHLMNRSPDPIQDVHLSAWGEVATGGSSASGHIQIPLSSLPPCTDFTFGAQQFRMLQSKKPRRPEDFPVPADAKTLSRRGYQRVLGWHTSPLVDLIRFEDRDGRSWIRQQSSLDRADSLKSDLPGDSPAVFINVTFEGVPAVGRVASCGDE